MQLTGKKEIFQLHDPFSINRFIRHPTFHPKQAKKTHFFFTTLDSKLVKINDIKDTLVAKVCEVMRKIKTQQFLDIFFITAYDK